MKNERFTIEIKGGTITVMPRRYYGNKDHYKSPRMYVEVADETVFDNIANRKRRPYNVYKTLIHSTNLASVLDLSEFRWSQRAGCTCNCSPGYSYRYFDLWLTLENAPSVDETKPARVLAGL